MEKLIAIITRLPALALLILIVYGIFKGVVSLINIIVDLNPANLAIFSLVLIVIPIVLTLMLALVSKNAANSSPAYYSILVTPIGILGLIISGIWYLLV